MNYAALKKAYKYFLLEKKQLWKITGGRRENVFAHALQLHPETEFPSFHNLHLPEDEIFSTIVRYGDYVQIHACYALLSGCQNRPVVVDVGAHHGVYAIILGKLVQKMKGKVIAVEPNPRAFDILCTNIEKNGLLDTVCCEKKAILNTEGNVFLSDSNSQSHVVLEKGQNSVSVESMTLMKLTKQHSIDSIDLLIVDVEGAELRVLESIEWNNLRIDRIFCEFHPYQWSAFGYGASDVQKFLVDHGFRCFDMYFREQVAFLEKAYIGPTFLVRR